ncbi:hypothetical protein MASR1M59_00360 [Melaminivora sp.]
MRSEDFWLEVDGGPEGFAMAFVAPGQSAPAAMVRPWLLGLSTMYRPLSVPGIAPAQSSNMQAVLANPGGQLSALWAALVPVRRVARVWLSQPAGPAQVVFDGVITEVQLGAQVRLSLEAGADRPLSDNLPLRTSAVWGGWRNVQVLPWVYGRATVAPIQYSEDQRLFLLADHPVQAVDAVRRDDVPVQDWAFFNGIDSTGQAVAFVELALPLAEGERLAVDVRGRMCPQSGALLQSPAQIVFDVLTQLARVPLRWSQFDDFRAQFADGVFGGVLADNSVSIRAALDGLVQSCGGAWSAAMPDVALLWPPLPDETASAVSVDLLSAAQVQADCAAQGLCTVLRLLYDFDHAAQRFRRAIQLRAPEAVREWGVLELEWPAPWLRTPRQAEEVGRRVLAYLARPRWRVRWQQAFADVATGAWVEISHPLSPITGRHRLLSAQLDASAAALQCSAEAAVGPVPAIETVALSSAFDPLIQPGVTLEVAHGEVIFTVRNEQGEPLGGAKVTLDGGAQRIADSAGRVSFPVQRGRHVLHIQAQGYPPSEVEVLV